MKKLVPDTPPVPAAKRAARSWSGFGALAETVAALTIPMLGKRGLVAGRLMIEWPLIVGDRIAARTAPDRLTRPAHAGDGGTLQVRVASGAVALELQHEAPQLIERINSYFGFRAVGRLRLVQGPVPQPVPPPPPPPPLSADAEARLDATLAGIEDPRLKQVLAGLGRQLHGRPRGPGA